MNFHNIPLEPSADEIRPHVTIDGMTPMRELTESEIMDIWHATRSRWEIYRIGEFGLAFAKALFIEAKRPARTELQIHLANLGKGAL